MTFPDQSNAERRDDATARSDHHQANTSRLVVSHIPAPRWERDRKFEQESGRARRRYVPFICRSSFSPVRCWDSQGSVGSRQAPGNSLGHNACYPALVDCIGFFGVARALVRTFNPTTSPSQVEALRRLRLRPPRHAGEVPGMRHYGCEADELTRGS